MQISDEVRAAMRATNERFGSEVVGQGRVDALDSVYTAKARILPPGAGMIEGREAIKEFWQQGMAQMGVTGASLETVDAKMCGGSVVEIGRATLRLKNGDEAGVKYVVHWKQEGGTWKWDVDIWNS